MQPDEHGNFAIEHDGASYMLSILHNNAAVHAYLYPIDVYLTPIGDRDSYALDLTALGEDEDDDWHDLPDDEIAANIAEALDLPVITDIADLTGARRPIPWAFGGPDSGKEAA